MSGDNGLTREPRPPRPGRRLLLVAFAALLFWASRGPWLAQPLVGEEGLYASMYSDGPTGPGYGLMVRVNGVGQWAELSHPAPMYEWMRGLGRLARALGMPAPAAGKPRILWVRTINALSTWLAWTILALAVDTDLASVAIFACLLVLPLAVGASLYMQTDTTCGWLLCGLVSLAFLKKRRPWILAAAALLGFAGKQEWLVGLGFALGVSLLWGALAAWRGRRTALGLGLLGGVALSAALGAWASRTFDPVNWDGGLHLMLHLGGDQNVLAHPSEARQWLHSIRDRSLFLYPLFAGLVLQTWLALRVGWDRTPLERRLALFWSWGLAIPFLLSIWGSEFRYLAPAMAAVTTALAIEVPALFRGVERRRLLIAGALALGLSFALTCAAGRQGRSLTESPGTRVSDLQDRQAAEVALAARSGCIPLVSVSYAWMNQLPNFAGEALGRPGALDCLKAFPGARLCP